MYTEEQFIKLEQEERSLTDEAIAIMIMILATTKGNIQKELRDFYSQYGKDGVVTYNEARKWVSKQDRRKRLAVLTLFVGGEFFSALGKLETHFRNFLTEVIAKESTFFGIKVNVDDVLARKWGLDDLYWLDRLEADVKLWRLTIFKDLKQMIHRGASLEEVLAQIDKRFTSIGKVLNKLGVSESTAVGSLARQDIFKELGIDKYRFYTKADERTCGECGALHGKVFPMSAYEVGITASPIHPWCRCWEVPIMG
jgi:SPP1 gp7 family putative phage head morphogenesis protein